MRIRDLFPGPPHNSTDVAAGALSPDGTYTVKLWDVARNEFVFVEVDDTVPSRDVGGNLVPQCGTAMQR